MSNANEPAFPTSVQRGESGQYWTEDEGGMTKREYIATRMMQTVLNGASASPEHIDGMLQIVAAASVRAADILLEELAKQS